jgi:hypothetical protein
MRDCYTDLKVARSDGERAAVCVAESGPEGEPRYVAVSAVEAPPVTPLAPIGNGDVLIEIAARCPVQGNYNVVIYGLSDERPFGAFYAQTDTASVPVEGEGTPPIADRLQVRCQGGGGVGFQSPIPAGTTTGGTPSGNQTADAPSPTGGGATASGTPQGTTTATLSAEDATATAEAAAGDSEDGDDDDGDNVWLWVIVGVAAAAAAGGLGFLAWRRYQAGSGAGPTNGGEPPADAPPPETPA